MTKEQFLTVAQWISDGQAEYRINIVCDWSTGSGVDITDDFSCWRKKPTKTLRPWRSGEVPVGALICGTPSRSDSMLILEAFQDGFAFCRSGRIDRISFKEAFECGFLHSKDSGQTWLPCGVEE